MTLEQLREMAATKQKRLILMRDQTIQNARGFFGWCRLRFGV